MTFILALLLATQSATEGHTLHVRDYGASPGTAADSGPAIRAAIADAMAREGQAIVQLEAGTYRIAPESGADAALPIRDAQNVSLKGAEGGTRLVITDPRVSAIRLDQCTDVYVGELTIDYDPLPFTQGTVLETAEDGSSFTIQCDEGYLEPDAAAFGEAQAPWGMLVTEERFGPIPVWAKDWESLGGRTWRCTIDSGRSTLQSAGVADGARFMYMARRYAASAILAWQCKGVTLSNYTVHAAPATASMWGMNEDVVIKGLKVARPEGGGRLLSTNADGIHCLGQRGHLLIQQCSFEGMADDAINIHSRAATVLEQQSPTELVLANNGTTAFRPGDLLQIYDPEQGRIRYEDIAVTAVDTMAQTTRLTLDPPVEGVVIGRGFRDADHVFNLSACGAKAVIQGNHFGNHRGRAILLKTMECIVERNTFENREGWGVTIHQLQDWGEGPAAQGVVIKNNTFRSMGTGHAPFIDIRPTRRDGQPASGTPVRNIIVERNQFENPVNGVLRAWAVSDLVIKSCSIHADRGSRTGKGPLIGLYTGQGIAVQNIDVVDPNPGTTAAVYIAKEADRVHTSGIVAHLAEGVPIVDRQ